VVELLRWVQEADDGQVADVVGGDFNCEPGSAAHALLRASWGMDVEEEQHGWHRITYDGLSRRPGRAQTVDYVFRAGRAGPRPQVRSSEIAMDSDRFDDRLSDHLGLEVSMVFRAAAGLDPDHERLAMARALVWPLPSE
jgi:endonuclease/exonuclease/phosphatase family metal-dependent hydrolase